MSRDPEESMKIIIFGRTHHVCCPTNILTTRLSPRARNICNLPAVFTTIHQSIHLITHKDWSAILYFQYRQLMSEKYKVCSFRKASSAFPVNSMWYMKHLAVSGARESRGQVIPLNLDLMSTIWYKAISDKCRRKGNDRRRFVVWF